MSCVNLSDDEFYGLMTCEDMSQLEELDASHNHIKHGLRYALEFYAKKRNENKKWDLFGQLKWINLGIY